jgi:hypothetical protein
MAAVKYQKWIRDCLFWDMGIPGFFAGLVTSSHAEKKSEKKLEGLKKLGKPSDEDVRRVLRAPPGVPPDGFL